MPGEPEASWGTMPLDDLLALLQTTTKELTTAHQTVAMDEAAYHRTFWATWQELPGDLSIAAMNRECERKCAALNETWILSRSLLEAYRAKQHALIAVIGSRA